MSKTTNQQKESMMIFPNRNKHTVSQANASQATDGYDARDGVANTSTTSFAELSIEQAKQVTGGGPSGREGEIDVKD
jgi:hypothetical protein